MAHYRMYLLDDHNKIVSGTDLVCDDDSDAEAQARLQADGQAFEVWQSTRRVFPKLARVPVASTFLQSRGDGAPNFRRFLQELLLA
jgi:hypothetical protein